MLQSEKDNEIKGHVMIVLVLVLSVRSEDSVCVVLYLSRHLDFLTQTLSNRYYVIGLKAEFGPVLQIELIIKALHSKGI